jgi:hypothetical protein
VPYIQPISFVFFVQLIRKNTLQIPTQAPAERAEQGHKSKFKIPPRHLRNVLSRVFPTKAKFAEMFRNGRFPDPKAPSFIQTLKSVMKEQPAPAAETASEGSDSATVATPAGQSLSATADRLSASAENRMLGKPRSTISTWWLPVSIFSVCLFQKIRIIAYTIAVVPGFFKIVFYSF